MQEKFEERNLEGPIQVTLEPGRVWEADKAEVCESIVEIVERFMDDDLKLSLRQLYYQLVKENIIPNHEKTYQRLSGILDDLRYAGKLDWDAIEDRGRIPYLPYHASGVPDALQTIVNAYRLDRQEGQPVAVEVWTEKDAISGILRRVTERFHVQLVVNKGYSSSSAMYQAYERFLQYIRDGRRIVILYFGDHDPSGLDMVRDIEARLVNFFCCGEQLEDYWEQPFDDPKKPGETTTRYILNWRKSSTTLRGLVRKGYLPESAIDDKGDNLTIKKRYWKAFKTALMRLYLEENGLFKVEHVGLTKAQIRQYDPPPNPAKITDPRAAWYLDKHGKTSWEVDALDPAVMSQIITDAITRHIDAKIYNAVLERERKGRAAIQAFASEYKDDEE